MKIPVTIRSAALVASLAITFAIIDVMANYALPETRPGTQVALAASAAAPR